MLTSKEPKQQRNTVWYPLETNQIFLVLNSDMKPGNQ
jgi:hypothetical protein